MKSKMIAVVMAVLMVATATAVVASDGSDANPIAGDVYVAVDGSKTVTITITEPDIRYYTNTATWKVGTTDLSTAQNIGTDGTVVTSDPIFTIAVSKPSVSNTEATYTVTIEGKSMGTVSSLSITYELTTFIRDSTLNSVTQTLEYNLNVTVVDSPLKAAGEDALVTGKVGTPLTPVTVIDTDSTDIGSNYVYYAIGLPDGLQMIPTGTISGTPVNTGEGSEFTVVATHKDTNLTFTATYKYNIAAAEITDYDFTYTVDGNPLTGEKYVVYSGNSVNVVTTIKSTNTPTNVESFKVIDQTTGAVTTIGDGKNGSYTIDETAGTGSYMVVMTNGDVTYTFELVVVANPYTISTGIGFTPGP